MVTISSSPTPPSHDKNGRASTHLMSPPHRNNDMVGAPPTTTQPPRRQLPPRPPPPLPLSINTTTPISSPPHCIPHTTAGLDATHPPRRPVPPRPCLPLSLNSTPISKGINSHQSRQSRQSKASSKSKKTNKQIRDHKNFPWIVIGSFLLCFNAGYVNNISLNTSYQTPSAHVTGLIAKMSIALATDNYYRLEVAAVSYLFFLFGATLSGLLIAHETFYLGRTYGRVFLVIAVVQMISLLLEYIWKDCVYFVYGCAVSCGIQNALTSKYSGNIVRTTHLTGATTDMGISVGHIFRGRQDELWRVFMHTTSITGFFLGGFAGWHAFHAFQHRALLANIMLVITCGLVHTVYISYHENIKILEVLEATKDIKMHRHRVTLHHRTSKFTFDPSPRMGHHHHHHHYQHHLRPPIEADHMLSSYRPPPYHAYHHRGEAFITPNAFSDGLLDDHSSHHPIINTSTSTRIVELGHVSAAVMMDDMVAHAIPSCSSISSGGDDHNDIELPPELEDSEPEFEEGDVAAESSGSSDEDDYGSALQEAKDYCDAEHLERDRRVVTGGV